jgi:prophage regulatory protein
MKILSKRELKAKTSISVQHLDRLEKAGRFPKRIRLTQNRVGWLESEVDEWIKDRIAERDSE